MAAFKKINVKNYSKGIEVSPVSLSWKQYAAPVLIKDLGPIDYIDFSPTEPHYFAVTCSARVQLYNPITKLVTKNFNKFTKTAYGGAFRGDGKLLCAGGDDHSIKIFDVSTKRPLRDLNGHTAPVHRCFFTSHGQHLVSFSDDKSTALWDIVTQKQMIKFDEHTGYIRAGAVSPVSSDIFVSGSYDNTVKMYDTRTNKSILSVNHDANVQSVVYLPSGGIFISAGGTEMRVWDALAGGRLLAKVSAHHRAIMCLKVTSNGRYILSGSQDRHVKIYDVATYNTVHTLDYPNDVLSIGISADDETIVAGMLDGLISVRRKEDDGKMDMKTHRKKVSYRQSGQHVHTSTIDVVVPREGKEVVSKHDTFLRKFQYSKALDSVMVSFVVNKTPHVTVALLQELTRRQGLQQSLAGRDGKSLVSILKFLIKYLGNPRFSRVLLHVADVLMDVYEDSIDELGPEPRTMFTLLAKKLTEEEQLAMSLAELQGTLHMLLSGTESSEPSSIRETQNLEPSSAAQKNLILSIA